MDVILLCLVISCMHHCVCGRRNLNSGNNTNVYILNEKNNSFAYQTVFSSRKENFGVSHRMFHGMSEGVF
jgi:hypothetical protein